MHCIEHMLFACQSMRVPELDHRGQKLECSNIFKPGEALTQSIPVLIKGDWAEHAHTLSLSAWNSTHNPCQYCKLCKNELWTCDEFMAAKTGPPWPLRRHEDYDASCSKCEIFVKLRHQRELRDLALATRFTRLPKSTPGFGGRLVFKNITVNSVALSPGDRLVPSDDLMDVGKLTSLVLPATVVFWRARRDEKNRIMDPISNRSPFFSSRLHLSPQRSLAIDFLHTVAYGPVIRFVSAGLWRMILKNTFKVSGDIANVIDGCVNFLTAELDLWQACQKIPSSKKVSRLTVKMLGNRGKFNLKDSVFFEV